MMMGVKKMDMPSYIRGEDYPNRLYQFKQDLLNAKLQQPMMPVQTQGVGNMDNQPNQWQSQGR